jgi:hypothetical protein
MDKSLTLSRHKLVTFLACQRRFQLRYRKELPWPAMPLGERAEAALTRGQQFHQLLERYFLGLAVDDADIKDVELGRWWSLFKRHEPALFKNRGMQLANGRYLPEHRLTIPIDGHLLAARFDLLVVGQDEASGEAAVHVFDWKTGHPQAEAELRQDWQTRLYLAMMAEGGGALLEDGRSQQRPFLNPDNLDITYWYVSDAATPRTIRYNQAWHDRNWAELQATVAQIEQQLRQNDWPLTDDWSHCRMCAYQIYCGRQEAGTADLPIDSEADDSAQQELQLEPDLP